jgi:hypothetical protein
MSHFDVRIGSIGGDNGLIFCCEYACVPGNILVGTKSRLFASLRVVPASDRLGRIPQGENTMLRSRLNYLLVVVAALFLMASTAVRAKDAGPNAILSSTVSVLTPVTVGGTSVKPGTYIVKAEGTKVTFLMNGKTIAQANVQWKDSDKKAKATNMLAQEGAVKEIHFSGKTRYVEIAD